MKYRILLAAFEWIVFAHHGQWFKDKIYHMTHFARWRMGLLDFVSNHIVYCLHFHFIKYSMSGKTSAHKIPFRLETVRLYVAIFTSDWNVADGSTRALSRHLPNLKLVKTAIDKNVNFAASSLLFASCNSHCHICWATMGYATTRKWRRS